MHYTLFELLQLGKLLHLIEHLSLGVAAVVLKVQIRVHDHLPPVPLGILVGLIKELVVRVCLFLSIQPSGWILRHPMYAVWICVIGS